MNHLVSINNGQVLLAYRPSCIFSHEASSPFHKRGHADKIAQTRRRHVGKLRAKAAAYPDFIPALIDEIQDPTALALAARLERVPVQVSAYPRPVETSFLPPARQTSSTPPVVLLPSFDSSILEFRRLVPALDAALSVWSIDLVGWGFTQCGFEEDPALEVGPQQKREHLYAFWKQEIGVPMVLLGSSLGGTIALDFALHHPEAVEALVLLDPQANSDGVAQLPRPIAWLGVQILRTVALRQMANNMAYYDKQFATKDAMLIGRLHTHMPGWLDANIAFINSGGYKIAGKLGAISAPTLLLWGRHDEILPPENAERLVEQLPQARLVWAEKSSHVPHIEEARFTAQQITLFVMQLATVTSSQRSL